MDWSLDGRCGRVAGVLAERSRLNLTTPLQSALIETTPHQAFPERAVRANRLVSDVSLW